MPLRLTKNANESITFTICMKTDIIKRFLVKLTYWIVKTIIHFIVLIYIYNIYEFGFYNINFFYFVLKNNAILSIIFF